MDKPTYLAWRKKIDIAQAEYLVAETPGRDEEELLRTVYDSFADELRESIDFASFNPSADILESVVEWADAPVFLCGAPGEEMAALQQRLSVHQQLVCMPGDSGYWDQRKFWKGACIIDVAREWTAPLLSNQYFIPRIRDGNELAAYEDFLKYLHFFMHGSKQDAFVCAVMAYYAARKDIFAEVKHWVERSPINEVYVYSLAEQFPGAKFIHLTMNSIPSSNYLARSNIEQFRVDSYLILDQQALASGEESTLRTLYGFLGVNLPEPIGH